MKQELIDKLLNSKPAIYPDKNTELNWKIGQDTANILALILLERKEHKEEYVDKILELSRAFLFTGRKPTINLDHFWHYPLLVASIDLMYNTPSIKDKLTQSEIEDIEIMMEAFLYVGAFGTNDTNRFTTGLELMGNYQKDNISNYRFVLGFPMAFCIHFFGGIDNVNFMLAGFEHQDMMDKFRTHKFLNAYNVWHNKYYWLDEYTQSISTRTLMEEGGHAVTKTRDRFGNENFGYGGYGAGVRDEYTYHDKTDPKDIILYLLQNCYNKTIKSVIYQGKNKLAYIMDDSTSPSEGLSGGLEELDVTDGLGVRSDLTYGIIDSSIVISCLMATKELGIFDINDYPELLANMKNGHNDVFYKNKHGYHGVANGIIREVQNSDIFGFDFWEEFWTDDFAQ